MAYIGEGVNEYGTPVTIHKCDTCGDQFSVCPAAPTETRDQWDECLADTCDSYDLIRDAERYVAADEHTND